MYSADLVEWCRNMNNFIAATSQCIKYENANAAGKNSPIYKVNRFRCEKKTNRFHIKKPHHRTIFRIILKSTRNFFHALNVHIFFAIGSKENNLCEEKKQNWLTAYFWYAMRKFLSSKILIWQQLYVNDRKNQYFIFCKREKNIFCTDHRCKSGIYSSQYAVIIT